MTTFQEVDQIGMTAPVTKGSWLIHDRRRIPEFVATAFRTAMSGRPGPVHLTLPIDIQDEPVSEEELPPYLPSEYRNMGRPQGDPALIQQAADLLRNAQRPVIIVGNPARYTATQEQLTALVEATGIPAFTVEQARGMIDDEHDLCFGYADGALKHRRPPLREADVVLLLGKRLDHRYRYARCSAPTPGSSRPTRPPPKLAATGAWPSACWGDLGAITEQLTAAAGQGSRADIGPWVSQLSQDRQAWLDDLRANATGDEPMHPLDVYTGIEHLIDEDSFIVMDGGDYVQWGRSYFSARQPGRFLRLGP